MSAFLTPGAEHTFATALVVGILAWAALWTLRQGWRWLMARADRNVAAMVDHALEQITADDLADDIYGYPASAWDGLATALDLPPLDAPDEAFDAWAIQALRIANDHTFDTTLGEILALPETETA